MTGLAIVHLITGASLGGLGLHTLFNFLALPRLDRLGVPARVPRMSVLVPARNEATRVGAAVRGWAAQAYPDYEVLVYDDDSWDDTAAEARAAAAGAPHVRVIRGGRLPDGWRGKPWACHRLRHHARGEILVFADADVSADRDVLARTAGAFGTLGVDALSAVPLHEGSRLVRALVAVQNWAVLTFVPSWLGPARRPWQAALTGQFIAIRADAYDASGGFAAERRSVAEDTTLARRLVAAGYRIRLLDGAGVLRCRPYRSVGELWRANVRNLLPVFFDSPLLLLLALAALTAVHLGPLGVLAAGAILGHGGTWLWTWLPLLEVALGLGLRLICDLRTGYPPWLTLFHPVAVVALLAMGFHSVVRFRLQRIVEWRDREYDVVT